MVTWGRKPLVTPSHERSALGWGRDRGLVKGSGHHWPGPSIIPLVLQVPGGKEGAGSGARSKVFNWSKKQGHASLRSVPRSPLLSVSLDFVAAAAAKSLQSWLASSKASGPLPAALAAWACRQKVPTLVKPTGGVVVVGSFLFCSISYSLLYSVSAW